MLPNAEFSVTELHEAAQRIKALRRSATEHAVEIGRELLRVKERLPHGVFVKWVERACEFKIRTAQDLMKLAREAESDTKLVALMLPSTLRVYLSKTTPPAVRNTILKRLENGERVSRNELCSQVSDTRTKAKAEVDNRPARGGLPASFFTKPELVRTGGERRGDMGADRARMVAEMILRRLGPEDYELIMEGMNWEVWNRVFVWIRAAQVVGSERTELTAAMASAAREHEVLTGKIQ